MFASPHFRRERFEPGCSDGPGSPGTRPTEATAAAVVCCVRTEPPGTGLADRPGPRDAAASRRLTQSSYLF